MHEVKTVNGVTISLGNDGRFMAMIGGRIVRRAKLSDLESVIRKRDAVPVSGVIVPQGHYAIGNAKRVIVKGYDLRSKRLIIESMYYHDKRDEVLGRYDTVYHCDDATFAQIEAITTEINDLLSRRSKILAALRRVVQDDLSPRKEEDSNGGS